MENQSVEMLTLMVVTRLNLEEARNDPSQFYYYDYYQIYQMRQIASEERFVSSLDYHIIHSFNYDNNKAKQESITFILYNYEQQLSIELVYI